jgi:hypothetical protein
VGRVGRDDGTTKERRTRERDEGACFECKQDLLLIFVFSFVSWLSN